MVTLLHIALTLDYEIYYNQELNLLYIRWLCDCDFDAFFTISPFILEDIKCKIIINFYLILKVKRVREQLHSRHRISTG